MERIFTAIIGGGAAGLFLATKLSPALGKTVVFERGERVGRKLSATGNGQGNITNLGVLEEEYFSSSRTGALRAKEIVARFDHRSLIAHLESAGLLLSADSRGRVYPAGRQASALTDGLRFLAAERGTQLRTNAKITKLVARDGGFLITAETPQGQTQTYAENVVLCTGGKAAKNFGSDGSAYALAQAFGHTLTPLYPSLVQLKTPVSEIRTLKGIRASDARVTAKWQGGQKTLQGDLLFTDYGVSGDVIFRLSAFVAAHFQNGVSLVADFLPDFPQSKIERTLEEKRKNFPDLPAGELLCGIVNNQLGRAIMKRVGGEYKRAAYEVKNFSLQATGTLGFDYAQVTKGGIPLEETDGDLQSKFAEGLYFAGEILDVDGPCGGFNLQWAYSSACAVAAAIREKNEKNKKEKGQV